MAQKRRVVINALQDKVDGFGVTTMVRELFSEYTAITDRECAVITSRDNRSVYAGEQVKIIHAPIGDNENLKRSLFLSFRMGIRYCGNADLLTSDAQVPLILPRNARVFPVVTDLSMFRCPKDYRFSRVIFWKTQYAYLKKRAQVFLAISEFTKQEMVEILRISPERIQVAHCACPKFMRKVTDEAEIQRIRHAYSLPEHYLLFAGNENKRKNVERLIAAYAKLRQETDLPHQLVIAGGASKREDVRQMIADRNLSGIRLIDYVPKEDLPGMVSGADAYVYLSLYEGFGIPILEAQRCGVPVLAADGSALRETGGAGALYVNPESVEEISDAVKRILCEDTLREDLIRNGYENEERFSWSSSAQIVRNAVEKGYESRNGK